jgi:isopentenyl-diphosphate Delta-isomerase
MAMAPDESSSSANVIPAIGADGVLFPIDKMEAHRQGALHLAVSVFVMSGDALLLQRRALSKYHCGGLWANTCCSHPHWGEAPADSATRRLREELGIALPLKACSVFEYKARVTDGLWEHERVHIFRGEAKPTLAIEPDAAEVLDTRWLDLGKLRHDALQDPERYAPWFRIYLARWDELGL